MITQKILKEMFTLNSKGQLVRNFSIGRAKANEHSTCEDKDGYLVVGVKGKSYRAHRLVWMYVYGEFPDGDIDHINRDKKDNRIKNLRISTKSQNRQNISVQKNNKIGLKGVWLHAQTKKWCASIGVNGKNKHLGSFDSQKEAAAAYATAAMMFHEFNNLTKI